MLVGTSRNLFLIKDDKVISILDDKDTYYGITWSPTQLFVVERRKECITMFQEGMPLVYFTFPDGLKELHALHYNSGLYAIETQRNCIVEIGFENEGFKRHFHRGDEETHYHINTMFCTDDYIYVVEHNNTVKTGNRSMVVVYNYDFKFIREYKDMGNSSHNVCVDDGYMYVCNSMEQSIIKMNMETEEKEIIDMSQYHSGLTRGISFVGDRRYVGISEFATRKERHLGGNVAILEFDKDWNFLNKIRIKGCGQLLEIRVIEGIDRCHNGIPFPKDLYSLDSFSK